MNFHYEIFKCYEKCDSPWVADEMENINAAKCKAFIDMKDVYRWVSNL